MSTLVVLLYVLALVSFLLAVLNVNQVWSRISLLPLGLMFLTMALIVSGGFPLHN